jgi:hypothetical protein
MPMDGLGGALASQAIQVFRDRAHHLAAVRAAAQAVRAEISMNSALAQIVIRTGAVPAAPLWPSPSRSRFDRLIEVLVTELPRREVTSLLGFDALYPEFERIVRECTSRRATPAEIGWLLNQWWQAANLCQMLLDVRGGRFWDRLLHRHLVVDFEKMQKAADSQLTEFSKAMGESANHLHRG